MDKAWVIFTSAEGNFLIRLLLAHFLADFALQTGCMVSNKRWFSGPMLAHISIVLVLTLLFTLSWKIAVIVAVSHWLTDSLKKHLEPRLGSGTLMFCADQLVHLLVLLAMWVVKFDLLAGLLKAIMLPLNNYQISLLLLAYVIVIWPVGYLIGFVLKISSSSGGADRAGRLIGQFERIIILTLVLMQQYEAIGFLITGKSIIRFSGTQEEKKSEYVLLGTMLS